MRPRVLYEDNHLLVIDKPVGMTTQGALPGEPSAVEWAKQYLKERYQKPGNVFLGVVSRLDRDVSGVLILARTSKGAARLNDQFRERSVEKTYWAVVEGTLSAPLACTDRLAEDKSQKIMTIVEGDDPDGQEARLTATPLSRAKGGTLVEVSLETGRKHQIRVQLSSRGLPIVGDRKYGARRKFAHGIALHARRLACEHPTRRERMTFEAPPPASWAELGVES
jgi:23S rRNA pseudouridine1911/1915/1917 synthase